MNTRKLSLGLLILIGVIVGLGIGVVTAQPEDSPSQSLEEIAQPLAWLIQQIDHRYVEEVKHEELLIGAMQGILSKLDDYSTYMPAELLEDFESDTRGEFGGLGIRIRFDALQKAVVVDQTIPGTPAFEKRVLAGDLIVEIDEGATEETIKTSSFKTVYDAIRVLRGEPGSTVTITILRGESREQHKVTITRAIIRIPGVRAAELIDPERKIGYIYVAHFHQRMVEDLAAEVAELREEGAEGLILDLRFNPGGLLSSALGLANLFLDDKLIVRVESRTGPVQLLRSRAAPPYPDISLVVLVNKYSASASEIVAAALSDHKRAVVVGEPTHGKASVQQIFHLSSLDRKDAVKLTIAHYYTPSNQPIAKEGVHPDITVEIAEEDITRLVDLLSKKTGYPPPDPDEQPARTEEEPAQGEDAEEEFHDIQLERAMEIMAGLLGGKEGIEQPAVREAALSGAKG